MAEYNWPYPDEFGQTETVDSDILVLGGGLAGCFAAIAAARKGKKVVLVEKGATKRSGAAGTGFDHWESACTKSFRVFMTFIQRFFSLSSFSSISIGFFSHP